VDLLQGVTTATAPSRSRSGRIGATGSPIADSAQSLGRPRMFEEADAERP